MNQWGRLLRLAIFGESHGPGVGVVVDGVPAGMPIDEAAIAQAMARRRPNGSPLVSPRDEPDHVQVMSGAWNGHATGAPVALWVSNVDARSKDYASLVARPGHADLTEHAWSRGHRDPRGGGHQSGRLTAPLVAAGALLEPFLAAHGVRTGAHVHAIGAVRPAQAAHAALSAADLDGRAVASPVHTAHAGLEAAFVAEVEAARAARDSVGGQVGFRIEGLPTGAGAPMMEGIEGLLGSLLFAVPAVQAVEFGAGAGAASMRGSQHNPLPHGILGGRATGAPILGAVALKPTSTIPRPQPSVDLATMEPATAQGRGRHDPCIAIRATWAVKACAQLAAAHVLLQAQADGLAVAPAWPRPGA